MLGIALLFRACVDDGHVSLVGIQATIHFYITAI